MFVLMTLGLYFCSKRTGGEKSTLLPRQLAETCALAWALGSDEQRLQYRKMLPMDLGIAGRRAIVCAPSKGLGRGCALALARVGVHVVVNGRHKDEVEATAAAIRAYAGGFDTRRDRLTSRLARVAPRVSPLVRSLTFSSITPADRRLAISVISMRRICSMA